MVRFDRLVAILTLLSLSTPILAAEASKEQGLPASNTGSAYAPQTQDSLKQMLRITWKKGPNLPQGFQDSDGGIIGHTLISVDGFCTGEKAVPGKPGIYPRGFLKKVFGLDLSDPEARWIDLLEFPGAARQELFCSVVDQKLYCWGGFSYSEPFAYKDGYRLSQHDARWTFDPLPALPSAVSSSGICAIGSKIYVCGGADYDHEKFYTRADRSGNNQGLGARLLAIDTKNLAQGWKQLASCPGSPRSVFAMAAVDGKIFVLGGAGAGLDGENGTIVDNWRYEPATDHWTRLRDLPVASGNFPAGQIVYKERYILLVGGYQYKRITNPDGSTREPYGTPFQHYKKNDPAQPSLHRYFGDYYSDVFVYDTKAAVFGKADPLPMNNNLPMTVVQGDQIYLIGGETGGSIIEGERFGHHPELFLKGTISEIQ